MDIPTLDKVSSQNSTYPPQPRKPLDEECCGNGCSTCVFDLYDLELERWKRKCQEIDSNQSPTVSDDVINIYEYTPFRISSIQWTSDCIVIFDFEIPNNGTLPIECGQHIVARSGGPNGKDIIIRPYTPISRKYDRGYFRIACKLYDHGEMSLRMKDWVINMNIDWRGPYGEYRYTPNSYKMLLLLAGGTGVTPMIQLIREILENEDDFTRVQLVYSIKSIKEVICGSELKEWGSYWNFNVCFCLTAPGSVESLGYGTKVHYGQIDESCLTSLSNFPGGVGQVLICGSKSFNDDLTALVTKLGVQDDHIHCFS